MQKFLRTFKISLLTAFMVLSLASSESSLATKPGEVYNDEVESRYTVRPEHHANREARVGGADINREMGCDSRQGAQSIFSGRRVFSSCVAVVPRGVITVGTGGYLCCAPTVGSA